MSRRPIPLQRKITANNVLYWVRWLAVLPGGLVCGFLLTFPLHWFLYMSLTEFIEPYPELPERLLVPAVVAAGFVGFGASIAPSRKTETAVVLFGLWMVLLGASLVLTFYVKSIGNVRFGAYGGGLAYAGAFVGGFIGFLIARHSAANSRMATKQ